jgi:NTP pyrophosphatase (non-canonical NTP hydrolase)
LFKELAEASRQMDIVVSKIQRYTAQRESAVQNLESQLSQLTAEEGELREKIRNLQAIPLPAAEYFAKLVDKGERSSAKRDYALFTAGVTVSVIVTIVLRYFRLA